MYRRDGTLYRQVNNRYKEDYDTLVNSGLLETLVKKRYLVAHVEESSDLAMDPENAYRVLRPTLVPYISYPYEWCFSQLKDAALLTLRIQKIAIKRGMSLKDASAYNVQFMDGKPIFIDTLSFETYTETPWVAYKQFCQHFLAPLALKAHTDRRLGQLLRTDVDGIPLDLTSKLLPPKTYLNFSVLAHIHLHAKAQTKFANSAAGSGKPGSVRPKKMSKTQMLAMIDQLEGAVSNLSWRLEKTEWGDYYEDTNYRDEAMSRKRALVEDFLTRVGPVTVAMDMGANNGEFSRIAARHADIVIAQDIDEVAVEKNYLKVKSSGETLLPLVQNLVNPSPAIGWANAERMSLAERGSVDVLLALALIHHLALSNNVPLRDIAEFFSGLGRHLIIEFVPKADSQVERLLATREDVFPEYDSKGFEKYFSEFFDIVASEHIGSTERTLYLLKSRQEFQVP
ncbi:MAG: hypothetical protein KDI33_18205 [Halioglobus sp.]|nr:hypothetical protein [Halioglobus sp.]